MCVTWTWTCAYRRSFLITCTTLRSCFKFSAHRRLYNDAFELHSDDCVIGWECNCGPFQKRVPDFIREYWGNARRILPKRVALRAMIWIPNLLIATRSVRQSRNWTLIQLTSSWPVFPKRFARGPLLASKNNDGSSQPCSRKYSVRMIGIQN
jgi:hypothetical protein